MVIGRPIAFAADEVPTRQEYGGENRYENRDRQQDSLSKLTGAKKRPMPSKPKAELATLVRLAPFVPPALPVPPCPAAAPRRLPASPASQTSSSPTHGHTR